LDGSVLKIESEPIFGFLHTPAKHINFWIVAKYLLVSHSTDVNIAVDNACEL